MSTIFDEVIEIEGIKYKRISMLESIKIQKMLVGAVMGTDLTGDEESVGKKIILAIYEKIDVIEDIFKIVLDQELETLKAGDEFQIIDNLVIEHPDFKNIIERIIKLKDLPGKIKALKK